MKLKEDLDEKLRQEPALNVTDKLNEIRNAIKP